MNKFYHFRQNNSGGIFDIDEHSGITVNVIIEAPSADIANYIATAAGIYFNGCNSGRDCSCCGDRWYPVDEYDSSETPELYGEKLQPGYVSKYLSAPVGKATCVHYLNGKKEWF